MPDTTRLQRFLKVDSCKDGDIVNFIDPGIIYAKDFPQDDGTKKTQDVLEMTVLVNGDKKTYTPNKTTLSLLNAAWGTNTEKWVSKMGKVNIIEQLSFGKLKPILVIRPFSAEV